MKITICFTLASVTTVLSFSPQVLRKSRSETRLFDDLFGQGSNGSRKSEMSPALPFLPRPKLLDGTLPGDVGFDPFNFAGSDKATLYNMREAEIKHCRLAMLAVVGWPLAELFDKPIADFAGLPSLLTRSGASPSVLNGGLEKIDVAYWIAVVALAGFVELERIKVMENKGKDYQPGDVGFDPFGFMPKSEEGEKSMRTKEIKHGRIAMMAILGFVVQEALYRIPVVVETPIFFKPIF